MRKKEEWEKERKRGKRENIRKKSLKRWKKGGKRGKRETCEENREKKR